MQAASLNERAPWGPIFLLCTLRGLPFGYLYRNGGEDLLLNVMIPEVIIVISECCIAR